MFETIAAWSGWRVVKALLPVAAALAVGVVAWFLVVSPRLENAKLEREALQTKIVGLRKNVDDLAAAKKAQDGLNKRAAEEMDRLATLAAASDRQAIIIHDRIDDAANDAGPQPVGDASRAYFDAVIAERSQELVK